jgi:hypothetical protein
MSTTSPISAGEFEFDESQNRVIGDLARKMSLVGFVMIFFGALQMINGVSSLVMSRNPQRMMEAAEKAGFTPEQIETLRRTLADGSWASPLVASALAFTLAGLLLLLVGVWTRQAAGGFSGIAHTKGKDISRLMDALGALHRKYTAIYFFILIAALVSVLSLAISLWHSWRGGA